MGRRVRATVRLGALALVAVAAGCSATVTAQSPAYSRVAGYGAEEVRIPPGQMPAPGECRVWYPESPPGHQPPPAPCERLERSVPDGAWLLHRPNGERRVYRVR